MESGFGIGNVNKRIWLYYGKPYGLSVESEYNTGTRVTLVIPAVPETGANGYSAAPLPEPIDTVGSPS